MTPLVTVAFVLSDVDHSIVGELIASPSLVTVAVIVSVFPTDTLAVEALSLRA